MTDAHAQIHGEIYAETVEQHTEAVKLAAQLSALADDMGPALTMEHVMDGSLTAHAELLRKAATLLADRENLSRAIDSDRYRHLRGAYGVDAAQIAAKYGFTELDRVVDFSKKGVAIVTRWITSNDGR